MRHYAQGSYFYDPDRASLHIFTTCDPSPPETTYSSGRRSNIRLDVHCGSSVSPSRIRFAMSDPCVPAVVAAEAALVKQNYALIFVGEQSRSTSNAPLLIFVYTSYLHRPDPIRHRNCSGSSCSTQRATHQPPPYLTPLGLHLLQSLPAVSSNVCTCIRPELKCS